MKTQFINALKFLMTAVILTGIGYPLIMTGVAGLIYPSNANGSLIKKDDRIIGSALIGQKFDSTIYFSARPSAIDYNPIPSGASNYGPASDTLRKLINMRRLSFARLNSVDMSQIPDEMIFSSGSGLDPHISPGSAMMQAGRIIKVRNFNQSQKEQLLKAIKEITEGPQFLVFGEPRINVLKLNIELDLIQNDSTSNK